MTDQNALDASFKKFSLIFEKPSLISETQIHSLMDLTCLDPFVEKNQIVALSECAKLHHMAGLCVLPSHLNWLTLTNKIKRVTVLNFPNGDEDQKKILDELDLLLELKLVDEIDYVFPYSLYLNGQPDLALKNSHEIAKVCKNNGLTFKVILETGLFSSMEAIYQLSLKLIAQGCDFLKTSTGKKPIGATPQAVFSILKAIKTAEIPCGLKVSGGIRSSQQASAYIALSQEYLEKVVDSSWFRIGASRLLTT